MTGAGPSGPEDRFGRVEAIFHEAMERREADREAFIRAAAAGDEALRDEALALLRAASEDGETFFQSPIISGLRPAETGVEAPGRIRRVGAYTLERLLGEGGMGAVYLARQDSPSRHVALKLIRSALVTPEMRRRFAREAHALGLLHHPAIAQIYEARLDAETPSFAMEHIEGLPLGVHAERGGLSPAARLGLLAEIADAVQHAHEKGVVHRDRKPGNILVTAEGRPKILDFGIARIADPDLRSVTIQTRTGQILGTVAYMSPEQASGDPGETGERSDVYSLGVIAYELLAGRLPIDLTGRSLPDAVRAIAEQEPPSLSAFDRALRGDIDIIVRTAIQKDPARRYSSAAALADDIRRLLRDEPIAARRPSAVYQARKFIRRRRALVISAAVVVVALVGGLSAATVGFVNARRAEGRALASADEARAAQARAEREAARAGAINDFLVQDLLAASSPLERGRDVRVADVLLDASKRVDEALADDTVVRGAIRATLSQALFGLGLNEDAEREAAAGLALQREALGDDAPKVAKSRIQLGRIMAATGRAAEAIRELESIYADRVALAGPRDRIALDAQSALMAALERTREYDRAIEVARSVIAARIEAAGQDDPATLASIRMGARFAAAMGRLDEAEAWLSRALESLERDEGVRRSAILSQILDALGGVALSRGDFSKGESLISRSLELAAMVHGEDSINAAVVRINHGNSLLRIGEPERAIAAYESALRALQRPGALEEAEEAQLYNIDLERRRSGAGGRYLWNNIRLLARIRIDRADGPGAEAAARELRASMTGDPAADVFRTRVAEGLLDAALQLQGRFEEAEPHLVSAAASHLETDGPASQDTILVVGRLIDLYTALGRDAVAEEWRSRLDE